MLSSVVGKETSRNRTLGWNLDMDLLPRKISMTSMPLSLDWMILSIANSYC